VPVWPTPRNPSWHLSIEPDDFDYAPFSQRGGLGKTHQLFGEQLPNLLDELNEVLAA
jgi:type I restriction enzyme R subunit